MIHNDDAYTLEIRILEKQASTEEEIEQKGLEKNSQI